MKLRNWAFLFAFAVLLWLWVFVGAQNLQNCRDRFGNNPWADCPEGCYCNTQGQPMRGRCCGTITLRGEPFCCIYLNTQPLYPCIVQSPLPYPCGYARCGYCGDVSSIEHGQCDSNYKSPSYATCLPYGSP